MSVAYKAVNWNRHKLVYDALLLVGIIFSIGAFYTAGRVVFSGATDETLIMRALAFTAFLLLHIILCVGPLCRMSPRFLPLLYNRRHMGVAVFLVGLVHAVFALLQYSAGGVLNPLVALLARGTDITSIAQFPFEFLGLAAIMILFLMAATSHDFWLANLTPRLWKRLHMLVYVAYALIVAHVAIGFLQDERRPVYLFLLLAGVGVIAGLHVAAGFMQWRRDARSRRDDKSFVDVCPVSEIIPDRARVVFVGEESIAIFRHGVGGKLFSAISSVCAHQGGPLGEGKIIDGCATCPWHGYQYRPEDAQSPPPYTERLKTYDVRIEEGIVRVNPKPHAPGTRVEPAQLASLETNV